MYFGISLNTLYENNFDKDSTANAVFYANQQQLKVSETLKSTARYCIEPAEHIKKWVRVSADFNCPSKEWDSWQQVLFLMKFYQDSTEIQANWIKTHRFLDDGSQKTLYFDAKIPQKEWNRLCVQLERYGGSKDLYMDNLKIITFDE
ncbi:MAG: hypothetical protein IPL35_13985 [Sphingobacteriales bacterium]|nr:hypothetical protein [Sphingobacteriales bacterium]